MKARKKWLYEKWLEEHAQDKEKEKISKKIGVGKEKIVVKKVSAGGKALEIITDIFVKGIYIITMLIIMLLVSLAVTILLNADLRNYVFGALRSGWI